MKSIAKLLLPLLCLSVSVLPSYGQQDRKPVLEAFGRTSVLTPELREVIVSSLSDSLPHLPLDLGNDIRLLSINERTMSIQTSRVGRWSMCLLPRRDGESIIGIIEHVGGADILADDLLSFYSLQGETLAQPAIVLPKQADFLQGVALPETSAGLRLRELLSPLPLTLSWSEDGLRLYAELSLILTYEDQANKELVDLAGCMPRLVAEWNGSTFTRFTRTK